MLPPLNDNGYLPSGVHPATLGEIEERFGTSSEIRQVQMESLRWLVDLIRSAGVKRLVIDGSFVTEAEEPNDVDCVLLIERDYPRDAEPSYRMGCPFCSSFSWSSQTSIGMSLCFSPRIASMFPRAWWR
jgi:hypothetical protein